MHLYFGGAEPLLDRHAVREGRQGVNLGQRPALGIGRERRQGDVDLVDHVGKAAFWMKGEVPRARSRLDGRKRRVARDERPLPGIEAIDEDLVDAQVGGVGEPVVGTEVDRMGARRTLTRRVDARSGVLNEGGGRLQPAVEANRQHRDAAAAIVRDEHVAPGLVHDEVNRTPSARRLLVERRQLAAAALDGEAAHRPRSVPPKLRTSFAA